MKMKEKQITLKNQNQVTIRTASPNEADAILDFLEAVCAETDFNLHTQDEVSAIDKKQEQEIIADYEKAKRSIYLAAYSGNEVIASCTVGGVSEYAKESHRAKLDIAVKQQYWNLGLGSALLSTAIDFASKVGYEQIELDAVKENVNALLILTKFEFEAVGSFPRAIKIGENYRDSIRFVKSFGNEA